MKRRGTQAENIRAGCKVFRC